MFTRLPLSYFNYQHHSTMFLEGKLFSDFAEIQPDLLSQSAVRCHSVSGWVYGREQVLAPCLSSVQVQ